MNRDRIERLLRGLFILLSLVALGDNVIRGDWVTVASAVLTVLFLQLPPLVEKLLKIKLPLSFRWTYLAFIVASMYLGELHSFFYRVPVWDIILHTASAMGLAYITFILAFTLNRRRDLGRVLSPLFVALFVFSLPVALGAVWELFEYAADRVLGVNMIKAIAPGDHTRFYDYRRGFLNSLHDLLMDSAGAFAVAAGVYLYLRRAGKYLSFFGLPLKQFIRDNPSLFSRNAEKPLQN